MIFNYTMKRKGKMPRLVQLHHPQAGRRIIFSNELQRQQMNHDYFQERRLHHTVSAAQKRQNPFLHLQGDERDSSITRWASPARPRQSTKPQVVSNCHDDHLKIPGLTRERRVFLTLHPDH